MNKATVREILETSGFKIIDPETRLTAALEGLKSSHDAIFVFSGGRAGQFLGLINIYYSLVKKKLPAGAKVLSGIYHPPGLLASDHLSEAARLMVESRVYRLPVFIEPNEFVGVVSFAGILKQILLWPELSASVKEALVYKKPITIFRKASVGEARRLIITRKTSRLIVVDETNKPIGVISTYDLRKAFSQPKESIHFLSRVAIKKEAEEEKVERFMSRNLVFALETAQARLAVEKILNSQAGSVLVFNQKGEATGIISVRDILKMVWQKETLLKRLRLLFHARLPFNQEDRENLFNRTYALFLKDSILAAKIKRASLVFKAIAKEKIGKPLIEVSANIRTTDEKNINLKAKGRKIWLVLKRVVAKIKRQLVKKS